MLIGCQNSGSAPANLGLSCEYVAVIVACTVSSRMCDVFLVSKHRLSTDIRLMNVLLWFSLCYFVLDVCCMLPDGVET